jgi:hypothetical protein
VTCSGTNDGYTCSTCSNSNCPSGDYRGGTYSGTNDGYACCMYALQELLLRMRMRMQYPWTSPTTMMMMMKIMMPPSFSRTAPCFMFSSQATCRFYPTSMSPTSSCTSCSTTPSTTRTTTTTTTSTATRTAGRMIVTVKTLRPSPFGARGACEENRGEWCATCTTALRIIQALPKEHGSASSTTSSTSASLTSTSCGLAPYFFLEAFANAALSRTSDNRGKHPAISALPHTSGNRGIFAQLGAAVPIIYKGRYANEETTHANTALSRTSDNRGKHLTITALPPTSGNRGRPLDIRAYSLLVYEAFRKTLLSTFAYILYKGRYVFPTAFWRRVLVHAESFPNCIGTLCCMDWHTHFYSSRTCSATEAAAESMSPDVGTPPGFPNTRAGATWFLPTASETEAVAEDAFPKDDPQHGFLNTHAHVLLTASEMGRHSALRFCRSGFPNPPQAYYIAFKRNGAPQSTSLTQFGHPHGSLPS